MTEKVSFYVVNKASFVYFMIWQKFIKIVKKSNVFAYSKFYI